MTLLLSHQVKDWRTSPCQLTSYSSQILYSKVRGIPKVGLLEPSTPILLFIWQWQRLFGHVLVSSSSCVILLDNCKYRCGSAGGELENACSCHYNCLVDGNCCSDFESTCRKYKKCPTSKFVSNTVGYQFLRWLIHILDYARINNNIAICLHIT